MPMFSHGDGNWSNQRIFFNKICQISLNISVKRKKLNSKKIINDHAKPVVCRCKFEKKSGLTLSLNKHSHKNFLGQVKSINTRSYIQNRFLQLCLQ